jgi:hypothetical protein
MFNLQGMLVLVFFFFFRLENGSGLYWPYTYQADGYSHHVLESVQTIPMNHLHGCYILEHHVVLLDGSLIRGQHVLSFQP